MPFSSHVQCCSNILLLLKKIFTRSMELLQKHSKSLRDFLCSSCLMRPVIVCELFVLGLNRLKHSQSTMCYLSAFTVFPNPRPFEFVFILTYHSIWRAPKWRSGLRHCISVLEASLQTLVRSWAVTQPAVIRRPTRRRTYGTASSELKEGLAGVGRHCKISICS